VTHIPGRIVANHQKYVGTIRTCHVLRCSSGSPVALSAPKPGTPHLRCAARLSTSAMLYSGSDIAMRAENDERLGSGGSVGAPSTRTGSAESAAFRRTNAAQMAGAIWRAATNRAPSRIMPQATRCSNGTHKRQALVTQEFLAATDRRSYESPNSALQFKEDGRAVPHVIKAR